MVYDLAQAKARKSIVPLIIYTIVVLIIVAISLKVILDYFIKTDEIKRNSYLNSKMSLLDQRAEEIKEQVENEKNAFYEITKNPLTEQEYNNIIGIYNNDTDKKIAYLTFDDGPSQSVTPLILDVLKKEKITASFFALGCRVDQNPTILKRVYEEGNYVGNHGYTHKYDSLYSSFDAILDEYNRTEVSIKNAIGNQNYNSRIFRFPGGSSGGKYNDFKKQAKECLKQNGIAYLDWNSLTTDSLGTPTKESMMESLKNTAGDKKTLVILMHDAGDKILTYEVLPDVIKYLRDNGYEFRNMYDLL